jgi:hypothetical protein
MWVVFGNVPQMSCRPNGAPTRCPLLTELIALAKACLFDPETEVLISDPLPINSDIDGNQRFAVF